MADLESILNGEPTENTEPVEPVEPSEPQDPTPPAEPEPEPTTGEPAEPVTPTDPTPEPDEVKGLRAAAAAERKKRQELETAYQQELAQLRQELAQRQTPEGEEPYIDEDVKTLVTQTESKFQQALVQQKLELSESIAREQHPDFDEKLDVFKDLLKTDPNLYNRMVQQPNPAGWMYKTAAEHQQMQKLKEIGDPVAYATKLEQELREKIRAEIAAEQAAATKQATEAAIRAKLPKSGFAEERSTGTARATNPYTGPTPLKSILGG